MRIPRPTNSKRARIEIIPLIDIMFFLLATFVMVSLSMVKNHGLPVNLPTATSSVQQDRNSYVSLTVNALGEFYFNKDRISIEDLNPRLLSLKAENEDLKVYINADAAAQFQGVVALLDEVRKAGISKVAVETTKKP